VGFRVDFSTLDGPDTDVRKGVGFGIFSFVEVIG
jgi:hypothetical protein